MPHRMWVLSSLGYCLVYEESKSKVHDNMNMCHSVVILLNPFCGFLSHQRLVVRRGLF